MLAATANNCMSARERDVHWREARALTLRSGPHSSSPLAGLIMHSSPGKTMSRSRRRSADVVPSVLSSPRTSSSLFSCRNRRLDISLCVKGTSSKDVETSVSASADNEKVGVVGELTANPVTHGSWESPSNANSTQDLVGLLLLRFILKVEL